MYLFWFTSPNIWGSKSQQSLNYTDLHTDKKFNQAWDPYILHTEKREMFTRQNILFSSGIMHESIF